MWVKEETGDITASVWDYDSFTKIKILAYNFAESRPESQLYCCTFSDGDNRFGYGIIEYHENDPSISSWGVTETTPYLYDLRANIEEVATGLSNTDID